MIKEMQEIEDKYNIKKERLENLKKYNFLKVSLDNSIIQWLINNTFLYKEKPTKFLYTNIIAYTYVLIGILEMLLIIIFITNNFSNFNIILGISYLSKLEFKNILGLTVPLLCLSSPFFTIYFSLKIITFTKNKYFIRIGYPDNRTSAYY